MTTVTIGQISSASTLATADYIEIEQSGVSKKADISMIGDALTATSAQSIAGSSGDVFITPATLRAGINAENTAPIYACRAWVKFDATTTSSSLTATYTRASGSTTVVVTATAHGCISGNVQYLDFTSGTASDNTYIVTVIDANSFQVTTIASTATSGNVSIKRCPINSSGNINNIAYLGVGQYYANFSVAMPDASYCICGMAAGTASYPLVYENSGATASVYTMAIFSNVAGGSSADYPRVYLSVFR